MPTRLQCPICHEAYPFVSEREEDDETPMDCHIIDDHHRLLSEPEQRLWRNTMIGELPHGITTQEQLNQWWAQQSGLAGTHAGPAADDGEFTCPLCEGGPMDREDMGSHIWERHIDNGPFTAAVNYEWQESNDIPACIRTQTDLEVYFQTNQPQEEPVLLSTPTVVPNDSLAVLLGASLAALIRANPNQPDLRGLILQKARIWVPEDQDLTTWLQNYQPPPPPPPPPPPNQPFVVVPIPRRPAGRMYEVEASYTEGISGRCRYTATEYYSGRASIPESDLVDMWEESDDRDDFVRRVEGYVQENREGIDHQETSDYDYSQHDSVGTNGSDSWEFPRLSAVVDQFLTDHPELEGAEPEAFPVQPLIGLGSLLADLLRPTVSTATAALPVTVPDPEEDDDADDSEGDSDIFEAEEAEDHDGNPF